jgi:hypothetical protein
MITIGSGLLALLLAGGARGPMVLRVDGLGPITVNVSSQLKGALPAPTPTGEQSKSLTGLDPKARDELRANLTRSVRGLLEGAGFEVRESAQGDEPLFVVRAEVLPDTCGDRSRVSVQAGVEIDEPAFWARDPTKRGFIVVWGRSSTHRVPRGEGAGTLEEAVLEGVREFVAAQSPAGQPD